jgi:hypothetical protein
MTSLLRIIKFAFQDIARNVGLSFMTVFILILMLLSVNILWSVQVVTAEAASLIKKSDDKKQAGQKEDEAKQAIQQKIETPILSVGVRLVVSAESKSRAFSFSLSRSSF